MNTQFQQLTSYSFGNPESIFLRYLANERNSIYGYFRLSSFAFCLPGKEGGCGVIVQSTEGFVESLNRLSRSETKSAKRFLRPLCDAIETLPQGLPLTSIALSNFQICEERGKVLSAAIGNDKIYGISFDVFYLAVAVLGKTPQICVLLTIVKK